MSTTWTPSTWPRAFQVPRGNRILLGQPQVSEWAAQRRMVAYAAVALEKPGSQKSDLGPIRIEADTVVSLDERLRRRRPAAVAIGGHVPCPPS